MLIDTVLLHKKLQNVLSFIGYSGNKIVFRENSLVCIWPTKHFVRIGEEGRDERFAMTRPWGSRSGEPKSLWSFSRFGMSTRQYLHCHRLLVVFYFLTSVIRFRWKLICNIIYWSILGVVHLLYTNQIFFFLNFAVLRFNIKVIVHWLNKYA